MNTKQIIGFHNPDEEYGYLSNWYRSDFEKDGIRFSSMEQYMMYQKARCFRDEKVAAEILKTDDVGRIKELGRQDRKSTRLNSSHIPLSRMPSSA